MGSGLYYAVRNGRGGFIGVVRSSSEYLEKTVRVHGVEWKQFETHAEAHAFAFCSPSLGAS